MSAPQYIPEYAENLKGIDILTPEQANVSGEGTSDTTLKHDFAALSSYVCSITGGCKSGSSVVTTDGTYNFGSKYFFNSNNKCKVSSSDNIQYCDTNAKVGDSVYQYIYLNTKSDGLLGGIITDVTNMATIPAKMVEIMSGVSGTNCKCVTLKVSGIDGGERCAGAFISTSDARDPNIMKNSCSDNIMDAVYNLKSNSSGSFFGLGKSGFTTMYINNKNNIEFSFFILIGVLMIIILYKLI